MPSGEIGEVPGANGLVTYRRLGIGLQRSLLLVEATQWKLAYRFQAKWGSRCMDDEAGALITARNPDQVMASYCLATQTSTKCHDGPPILPSRVGTTSQDFRQERKRFCKHTFQCSRVGNAVTFPRPSVLFSFSSIESKSELPLSTVERRVSARAFSKGSKLLCLLAGGVRGDCLTFFFGGSVGRKTAGT
jgi:hypothetical protein